MKSCWSLLSPECMWLEQGAARNQSSTSWVGWLACLVSVGLCSGHVNLGHSLWTDEGLSLAHGSKCIVSARSLPAASQGVFFLLSHVKKVARVFMLI